MITTMLEQNEQRLLLLTPLGKDAELACRALERAGLRCTICKTLADVLAELPKGAAAILSTEEALPAGATGALSNYLSKQPPWSDLPILVLTKPGGESSWIKGAYERLYNLTLLERPVRSSTLISAARSALRARLRQYEVRSADHRKDEFLAMLAHELRNPLAPISAAAEVLKLDAADAKRVLKTSAVIARQVGHMTNLIDDLLDVARVTRGLISYKREPLDFRQILNEAIEQVSTQISVRRHQVAVHLPPDPAPVLGDRERLIQAVANLLGNACKYTPEDGSIVIRLQVSEDEVMLSVEDNGIGMTEETVKGVFDLFVQAERTPDRSQGGLGLGLALAKNLVNAHAGTVHAVSAGLGQGSTFMIRLPRLHVPDVPPYEMAAAGLPITATGHSLRLLIVDDNADAANMLEMFLSAAGYQVRAEYSAAKAVETAKNFSPQVCLLDIGLPDMDGHELAIQLRALPQTTKSLIIAVTGYGQERDKEKSLASGFDHHFVKPIDTARLLHLLGQVSRV